MYKIYNWIEFRFILFTASVDAIDQSKKQLLTNGNSNDSTEVNVFIW